MQTAWKGNLSFGLLTLPIRMYKATSKGGVSFRSLHGKDKGPIKEKRFCSVCEEEVPYADVVKGYEISDGHFVAITKEELQAIEPESTSTLDVKEFVSVESIDPSYFEETYVLAPEKGGSKAYGLLQKVLGEERKVAVGKIASRGREHLVAVRAGDGVLYVEMMHFPEEVRDLTEVKEQIRPENPSEEEIEIAKLLVDRLTKKWDPEKYYDDYTRRVQNLIEKKAAGEPVDIVKTPKPQAPTQNLLEALRASLEQAKNREPAKAT